MKLHILSDLHVEFADFQMPETDADVIVLAGDIGVGAGGLEWLRDQNVTKPVVYVPGNHEYYQRDLSVIDHLRNSAPPNVYVLNDGVVQVGAVRFLGCTLWTDFEYFGEADRYFAVYQARKNMADFSIIENHGKRFTPEDSIALHQMSRAWLKCMLDGGFSGTTVVVTHHAPSSRSVQQRYANDLLTAAFASRLESMMDSGRVSLWVHGHMHDACDYEVYGTRVICNPRGYQPHEKATGFVPDLVVEV